MLAGAGERVHPKTFKKLYTDQSPTTVDVFMVQR